MHKQMIQDLLNARNPGTDAVAVTPSDATVYSDPVLRSLYVGTGGNVAIKTLGGTTLTFSNIQTGTVLPVFATQVLATGTTASNIVGIV